MQKASKRIKVLTPYILITILCACCYQLVVSREVLRKKRVLVGRLEKEFQNLEKLANSHGKDNIILIGSGFRSSYIFRDKKYAAWKEQMYLCKTNLYSKKNLSDTPSLTLVNAKGKIFAAHHATKSNNQHFELFFDFLRKRQIDFTSLTFEPPKTQ